MSQWTMAFKVESAVAQIITDQAAHGCNFNVRKAQQNIHILTEKIVNIDKQLVPMLPMMQNKGTSYAKPFVKSGAFAKFPGLYAERVGLERHEVAGPFTALWYTPFDTSKTERLKLVMIDLGWKPHEWTIKKNPLQDLRHLPEEARLVQEEQILSAYIENKIVKQSPAYVKRLLEQYRYGKRKRTIGALKDFLRKERFWYNGPKVNPEKDTFEGTDTVILKLIEDRMMWSHRLSMMKGLIDSLSLKPQENYETLRIRLPRRMAKRQHKLGGYTIHFIERSVPRLDQKGKLPGEANSDATPTHRMKHKVIVNIPAARAPFGHRCRSLFMGDYDDTVAKPIIYKREIKEGVRVKNGTNLLEEFDAKKGKWKLCGRYKIFVPKGQQSFVGYDGAALELRMLAHYLVTAAKHMLATATKSGFKAKIDMAKATLESAESYKSQILEGDIHSHNQHLAGLPTRDNAKTFKIGRL